MFVLECFDCCFIWSNLVCTFQINQSIKHDCRGCLRKSKIQFAYYLVMLKSISLGRVVQNIFRRFGITHSASAGYIRSFKNLHSAMAPNSPKRASFIPFYLSIHQGSDSLGALQGPCVLKGKLVYSTSTIRLSV